LLEPYAGYYFFNSSGLLKLKIPFRPPAPPMSSGTEKTLVTPEAFNALQASGTLQTRGVLQTRGTQQTLDTPQSPGWRVAIDLRTPTAVDRTAVLGISEGADPGLDRYDQRRPRATGVIPSVEFFRPEWDAQYPSFATDIRPPAAERQRWSFRVVSQLRSPLGLAWRASGRMPEHLYLIDEYRAAMVDLRAESVYTFVPATNVTPFAVVAGSPQELEAMLADLLPREFGLGTNFPNPFNPATTIPVSLPEAAEIRLAVFSLLGEEVRLLREGILPAGRHWFTWDGRGRSASPVAAGLYLCRLEVRPGRVFVRKMILMK
jgi:hypothetical protein